MKTYSILINKYFIKPLLIIFIFLSITLDVKAQPKNLISNTISAEQGLPGENVRVIVKDSKGFIWVGIDDIGLCKYDGKNFKLYNNIEGDSSSLSDNFIRCIYEDSEGTLWIGTDYGLNRFNSNNETFTTYYSQSNIETSISSNKISGIYEDHNGFFWIGSGKGLDILNRKTGEFKHILYNDPEIGLSMLEEVFSFYENNDILWIGGKNGLYEYSYNTKDLGKNVIGDTKDISTKINIRKILKDSYNKLWMATDFGLYYYDLQKRMTNHYRFNEADPTLSCMTIDTKNRIWVGSFNSGIRIVNSQNLKYSYIYTEEKNKRGITSDHIAGIYSDNNGLIWIGTKFGGIQIYNPEVEKFNLHSKIEGLTDPYVKTITEDPEGNIWIGTISNGIQVINRNNKTIKTFIHKNNDPNSIVNSRIDHLFCDKKGNIWIGTFRGLDKYNISNKKIEHILPNRILYIYEDLFDNLWISTIDGLFILNNKTKKPVRHNAGYDFFTSTSTRVNKIIEDDSGILWLSTNQNGLYSYKYKNNILKSYVYNSVDTNSISGDMLRSMCIDNENNLWIGTKSNGLIKYDRKNDNFIRYKDRIRLTSNSIFSILCDKNNNLWMGSSNGLIKFNPKDNSVYNFNKNHGIQGNVFVLNSRFKDSKGWLYFGGKDGFNMFHPDSITEPVKDYKIVLSNILLFNKTIAEDVLTEKDLILKYNENYLSFEFSTLDYSGTDNYQYYYKLENFDEDWVFAGDKNFVSYTNLPPGKYIFMVSHISKNINFKDDILHQYIIIKKPYWQTFWFRAVIVLLILFTAYSYYITRISVLKIKQNELEKQVNKRTNELVGLNTELQKQTEEIAVQNEEISQQNEEIISQRDEINKQRLYLETTLNNLKIISELGQKLNNFLDPKEIHKTFAKYIGSLMNCSIFGIGIYNKSTRSIDFPNFYEGEKVYSFTSPLADSTSCAAYCLKNQKPILSNNFDVEFKNYISDRIFQTEKSPQSLMYAPLTVNDKKIGVITVQFYEENAYNKNDLTNLQTLASYISIALDNADAYEKLKQQNIELEEHRTNLEKVINERASDLREAMKKAKESDQLKSAFLANLSHEIRTPLNAIIGFADVLTQEEDNELAKDEICDVIKTNSTSLLNIINDIVDFSLIDAGQVTIKKENFSLSYFINDLYTYYKEEIKRICKHENKNIEFIVDKKLLENNILINNDPFRLKQVFNNLINNAIKFTDSGKIEIGYSIAEKEITFFVADSGIGIDDKHLNQIFDRFWKNETHEAILYRGTGLGLSITKNLVELMEGNIYVISEKERGSTFYFTLPFKNIPENKPLLRKQISYISNPDWHNKTLLIVEDVNSNYAVLSSILKNTGATIIRATNGKEAIEMVSDNENVHLVLMDIKMPVMDGKEATLKIKNINKNIPVIAQTAYALATEERDIMEAGFDGYIKKPFFREKIIDTLSKFL